LASNEESLVPFLVTLGCALAFLGIAILGYDPARGFIQARRPG
jgi:hypothetical protein